MEAINTTKKPLKKKRVKQPQVTATTIPLASPQPPSLQQQQTLPQSVNARKGKKRKMDKAEISGVNTVIEAETNDSKREKKESPIFNDKNVDYNLYHEAPENVATKKIKLSSNVILMCKMIEATGDQRGLTYDYAALSIIRKTKNNKAYEFNLPLTIAPNLVKGVELIMNENKHFFQMK